MWMVTGIILSSLIVMSIFSTIAFPSTGNSLIPAVRLDLTIRFDLWTRKNPSNPFALYTNRADVLRSSPINYQQPVKILIHGFLSDSRSTFAKKVRETYLAVHDVNVVTVDWSGIAAIPDYELAFRNTRKVGQEVAAFIDFLVSSGMPLRQIHVVGFSLGAHVSGWVSFWMRSGRLVRITALDPAKIPENVLLDGLVYRMLGPSDAEFVDAIHTNGHPRFGLGLLRPVGHVDFYPNGGTAQPACRFRIDNVSDKVTCSHSMAYRLFAESIWRNDGRAFQALPCLNYNMFIFGLCGSCRMASANCNTMGEYVTPRVRGSLFLVTNLVPPYSAD